MAVCFIEAGKRKGNRKPANKMKATIFCNLITEMTFHHQILQAKTSHYIQPTLKERRIKKETRTRRWGSLEVILEICLKKWKVKVKSLSHIQLLVTPWTAAYQAPPSMGFSRQEYWSGVPNYIYNFHTLKFYINSIIVNISFYNLLFFVQHCFWNVTML